MVGLDTNILVRYLTQDDPMQSRRVNKIFEEAGDDGTFFINQIVLCELVWVLKAAYKYPKEEIIEALEKILSIAQFEIESSDIAWSAFAEYKKSKADFSDLLLVRRAREAGCAYTLTLDRNLEKTEGFKAL